MHGLRPNLTLLVVFGALLALSAPGAAQPLEEEPEETGSRSPKDKDRTRGIPPVEEEDQEQDEDEAEDEGEPREGEGTGTGTEEGEDRLRNAPPREDAGESPPSPAPAVAPAAARDSSGDRPPGFSVGVGVGYDFPADLRQPNTVSARFHFPNGLTIEPRARATVTSSRVEMPLGVDSETTTTDLLAEAGLRYTLIQRGKADFVVIGGASLSYEVVNPDGGDNDTRTTDLSLFAGLGVQYWLTSHWTLSVSTTNSLISYDRQSMDQAGGEEITTSDFTAGLVFDPDVIAMVHLYF